MNVCLLNDSFPPVIDGVANVVKNYADIMTEKELANVIVGTPKYHDGDYKNYPYPVIPYQSFKVKNMANGYRAGNPFCLSKLNKFVEFEPDIIHSHCPFASTVLAIARMVSLPISGLTALAVEASRLQGHDARFGRPA